VGECLAAAGKDNPLRFFSYNNEAEAEEVIAQYGSLANAITATLGDPIPVTEAQLNDVVVVEQFGRQITGIVHETDLGLRAVMRTTKGVVDWPLRRAIAAWRAP
jgi:hypothetical protein